MHTVSQAKYFVRKHSFLCLSSGLFVKVISFNLYYLIGVVNENIKILSAKKMCFYI